MNKIRNIFLDDKNDVVYIRFIIPTKYRKTYVIGVVMGNNKKIANICRSRITGLYYSSPGSLTRQTKDTKFYESELDAVYNA